MSVGPTARDDRQSPSRIAKVEIRNWKNFTNASIELRPRVFLVGPNASGKSNFLDLFRFLRDIVSVGGGFQEAVRRRGGVSAIRSLAARQDPAIELKVVLGSPDGGRVWTYELTFGQDNQRRPQIHRERVLHHEQELLRRPDPDDRQDPTRLTQTYLEQVNVNRRFREVAQFLGSIRYLHLVPQLVREPDRSVGRKNDPYGGDFIERVWAGDKRVRKARLRRITRALQIALPQLRELELWQDAAGKPHLRGKYEHWRPQGAWQMEEQFSDGTLRLLGLLWALLDGDGPLLLEEPELSLHPEVVRYLPQLFHHTQRKTRRQVIVSTHSADLLHDEGIGMDEVLVLRPAGEGTTIRRAGDVKEVRALLEGGMSVREAVVPYTAPKNAQQLALFEAS